MIYAIPLTKYSIAPFNFPNTSVNGLFCNIHHFLQYGEWQKSILDEKAENIIANMKVMFSERYEQYCKYSFKTEDTLDARQYRNFLFNDGQYMPSLLQSTQLHHLIFRILLLMVYFVRYHYLL